jgi:hypothetical protein
MTISATTAPNLQIGPVANQGPEQFEGLRVIVEVQVPAGRLRRARGALDWARKLRTSARGVLDPAFVQRAGAASEIRNEGSESLELYTTSLIPAGLTTSASAPAASCMTSPPAGVTTQVLNRHTPTG